MLNLDDLLIQVNEEDEDTLGEQDAPNMDDNMAMPIEDPLAVEVNIPVIASLEIFLPFEIQEEELMNDDEIQQHLNEEAAHGLGFGPQNLNVGFVFTNV
jgi:hypothetical protein